LFYLLKSIVTFVVCTNLVTSIEPVKEMNLQEQQHHQNA